MGKKNHKSAATAVHLPPAASGLSVPDREESATEPATPLGVQLWFLANAWQRAMRQALEPHGLTHVQFVLLAGLSVLLQQGRAPSQAQLAAHCRTDVMMTSQVVRALEAAALVERRSESGDRRARYLAMTTAGHEALDRAQPAVREVEEAFFAPLGKKRSKLAKHLAALCADIAAPTIA
jgi:DNA-binding MarR family transcriptional regulator